MEAMGWNLGTDTGKMLETVNDSKRWRKRTWKESLDADQHRDEANKPQRGDILLRTGHVGFFVEIKENNLIVFEAAGHTNNPQVGMVKYNKFGADASKWEYVMRPFPTAAYSQVGNTLGPH